jgi:elongation factor G
MTDMPVTNVRNFAVLGHTASGKTSLVDALLFKFGVNDRKGTPENGTSMADWTDEEKDRKISIRAKPFDGVFKSASGSSYELVMLDTPGYADFAGQMLSACSVADAALIVVDAMAGVQVGTNRAWRQCEKLRLPRAIAINGLDKENADFGAILAGLQSIWGARCLPVTVPAGGRAVSVLAGGDAVQEHRNRLVEAAAESDDALLEKFLGGEALTPDEVARGLRASVLAGQLVPVFAISAKTELGLDELCEGVAAYLPSPADRERADADGRPLPASPDAPLCAFVWRSIVDPFVGQLALVRVFSGTLRAESELLNVTRGAKERIGTILRLNGRKQEQAAACRPGGIVAIPKLKQTGLNDTLGAPGSSFRLPAIVFPNPVMAFAVTPRTSGDEDKLAGGLSRIAEEDPTLRVERNAETHELVLSGLGDVQLNAAIESMRKNSKVEVNLSTPKVAYKETITGRGEGHYKHKKQTGGRGQYGEVYLRVAPLPSGETEWFDDAVVGGTIPNNFMPAVQKGLVEGLQRGSLAGHPVVNVKVSVYDGSYHDVDSSEIAFKIAAARALRDGLSKARPVLLEPVMKVTVMVPEHNMGDVTGDLNHRRGRILGMGSEDGMQVITAEVPQAELFQYSSQMRSMTGGRGSFEMEFSRMDVVPANVAQKVVAEAQKNRQEEE